LVNASRGGVVEESDLVTALKRGRLAGAALDVFSKEPMDANSFLLKEPLLFLTPHTGAFTAEAWKRSSLEAVKKLLQFQKGEALNDVLPLPFPWFEKTLN